MTEPGLLADMVAYSPDMTTEQRQELLETLDVVERLKVVSTFLARQVEILELKGRIQSEVKSELDKTQREYILREQLKAIQRELGEDDPQQAEVNELREKVEGTLKVLSEREEEIIRLRFGIGRDMPYTLEEIGRVMGLSRERVRQIEATALKKIQQAEEKGTLREFLG